MAEDCRAEASTDGAGSDASPVCPWNALPLDIIERQLAVKLAAADVGAARAVCRLWAESIARGRTSLRPAALPPSGDCRCWSPFINMRSLDLTRCASDVTGYKLRALRSCTSLTSIDLSGCWKVTDESVDVLCGFSRLSSLNLTGCELLTDDGVTRLAQLPQLSSLDASGCRNLTNDALAVLAAWPLQHLRLNWCRNVTDAGLRNLAPLTSLRSLSLDEVKQIRDGGVQALVALTQLEMLSLRWCRNISDSGVMALAALASCLTDLHIDGCLRISDAAFGAISKLTNLSTLDAASTSVTDRGLQDLRSLSTLRHLSLANCRGVTHLALLTLPPGLMTLNMARCNGVEATADEFLAMPRRITSLNLLYCRPTMSAAITALRLARPHLQVLSGTCDA